MAILAHGTTLTEFTDGVVPETRREETTASRLAPYCAEGIEIDGDDDGASLAFAANSELWISFRSWGSDTDDDQPILEVSSDTTPLFRLMTSGATIGAEYWNGSTWVEVGTKVTFNRLQLWRHDLRVKMDNSVGAIDYYLDTNLQHSFAGDTILDTPTTVNNMLLQCNSNLGSRYQNFSAVIVADEDTREMEYSQTAIDAAGSNSDYTGDNTAVDEAGVNDADFISSATAGDVSTFGFGNLSADFNTGWDVVGLGVTARSMKGSAGVGFVIPAVYSGTTLGEGTSKEQDLAFSRAPHFFATDPDTATAFAVSGINSAEIGVKSSAS